MSCRLSAQILALVSISEEKVDKRMDMGTNGFYGDTFDSGFGSFETAKRRYIPTSSIHHEDMLAQRPRLDLFLLFTLSVGPCENSATVYQIIAQHFNNGSGKWLIYSLH